MSIREKGSEPNDSGTIYSPRAINFIKAAAEFCRAIEQSEGQTCRQFARSMAISMSALYASALEVEEMQAEEMDLECVVTEETYEAVREIVSRKLGASDDFLSVNHEDMRLSDEPILCHASEDIADIYQDIADLIHRFRSGEAEIMQAAVVAALDNFKMHWGECLLRALGALHAVISSESEDEESDSLDTDDFMRDDE